MQNKIGLSVLCRNEIDILDLFLERNEPQNLFTEIKFLDGCSTDGSYEKLKEWESEGWCKVFQLEQDNDFSHYRNYLDSLMQSEYIFWLDVDMYMTDELRSYIESFSGDKDLYMIQRKLKWDNAMTQKSEWICNLYRNNGVAKWTGRCHENITIGINSSENAPVNATTIHDAYAAKCAIKWKRYYETWPEHRAIIDAKQKRENQ